MDIRYRLSFPHPASHLAHVRIDLGNIATDEIDLVLPSWVPGSYKIRDFARNVQGFRAGRFRWKKQAKNRWRIFPAGTTSASVEYDVFCFELSVQTSHVDDSHAFLNFGGVLMYVDGRKEEPVVMAIDVPKRWSVATGLEPVRGGRNVFRAPNYDVLADCPTEAGLYREFRFPVRGVRHRLVVHGGGNYDSGKLVRDLRRICEAEAKMMGGLPYSHYTFLLHTTAERGGGLEHLNSTAIQYPPFQFQPPEKYENFLELAAHEFFHLWNVKRIRPEMLGPFDYEKEVYTTLLWVMEGITSYYDSLFPIRARVVAPGRYLKKTAERIQKYEEKPGRAKQSLSESSYDTWIKLYQPNENAVNSMMSYYEKGELVGLLLDLEIRRITKNRRSLDDVMRTLYRETAKQDVGFPESEFQKAVERISGRSFAKFFAAYVDGTGEIDWNAYLVVAGMKLEKAPKKEAEGGKPERVRTHLGILTQRTEGRIHVTSVLEDGPAWRDGLSARDEILALDGWRIHPEEWEKRILERRSGDRIEVTVVRDGRLRTIPVTLGKRENVEYKLVPVSKPTRLQKAVCESWLWKRWKEIISTSPSGRS